MLMFTIHFFLPPFQFLTELLEGKILGQQSLAVKVLVY